MMIDLYKQFVQERHQIWEMRRLGYAPPWTNDPVLRTRKFCNVFRILDAGSQFLVKELLYHDDPPFDVALMRCFLYRYTNRPEPWRAFRSRYACYPDIEDLRTGRLLDFWQQYDGPIFGSAYKMFVGQENRGRTRLEWAVNMTRDVFADGWLAKDVVRANSQQERFDILHRIPRCKDFMAMQILTDIGLDPRIQANENEFIVPGPGAHVGAKHIDPECSTEYLIKAMALHWSEDGSIMLGGRTPSLMDVQNTFCEFGKYVRWGMEPSRQKAYSGNGPLPEPFLPPRWKGTEE